LCSGGELPSQWVPKRTTTPSGALIVDRALECRHGLSVGGVFYVVRSENLPRSVVGYVMKEHARDLEEALAGGRKS